MGEIHVDAEGRPLWTGVELRSWAEIMAGRVDAGLAELTVDLEHSPELQVWSFRTAFTPAGLAEREERRQADRLQALVDGAACPFCKATGDRLHVRGEMPEFTRFRCMDCFAEFDVEVKS